MHRSGLKFLADENIPSKAVHRLQKDGIDIIHVNNIKYGLADNHVLKVAYKEKRILVTFDKEFGYLVFRKKMKSFGVILLRFIPLSPEHVANRINELIKEKLRFENNFMVVEEEKIRIRFIQK